MVAIVRSIETAPGFKKNYPVDHAALYTKVRIRMPFFFWWLYVLDPFLGKEGLIIKIEWDVNRGESRFTILFGDSERGILQEYSRRSLEFLDK